mmetsp:Transcript_34240/g.69916  ORF Transcript_34240/g.69916 Transcript_34240/m.69916 type:complete len:241 (+) Transcript_34240:348-1070(+)
MILCLGCPPQTHLAHATPQGESACVCVLLPPVLLLAKRPRLRRDPLVRRREQRDVCLLGKGWVERVRKGVVVYAVVQDVRPPPVAPPGPVHVRPVPDDVVRGDLGPKQRAEDVKLDLTPPRVRPEQERRVTGRILPQERLREGDGIVPDGARRHAAEGRGVGPRPTKAVPHRVEQAAVVRVDHAADDDAIRICEGGFRAVNVEVGRGEGGCQDALVVVFANVVVSVAVVEVDCRRSIGTG